MEDIKLLEQCPKCGENLTLMSSIRVTTELSGSEWLVKRCLKCGGYPCTEVVMLKPAKAGKALCNSSQCVYHKEGQCTKEEINIREHTYYDMGVCEDDKVTSTVCGSRESLRT